MPSFHKNNKFQFHKLFTCSLEWKATMENLPRLLPSMTQATVLQYNL
uniref:Uncharacterized protein n=1 Tax=Anguilla anguilla TaxID=7936 RepID=A0A0E9WHR1_ANGAN